MRIGSDVAYLKDMIGAGLNGVRSARKELDGEVFPSVLKKYAVWTPTVVGAAIGLLGTSLTSGRKSVPRVAIGGLLGSVVGFGGGVAWASRRFTGTAAVRAAHAVNTVRDAHWVETHPIAYG